MENGSSRSSLARRASHSGELDNQRQDALLILPAGLKV